MRAQDGYISPLSDRYVSREISSLFSPQFKFSTFRRLWVALAEAQQKLGLPISHKQIDQMKAHIETIDFERVQEHEKRLRHDVMAHIHAFGDQCPEAKPIIHLGATSSFVTDNTDLIILKRGFELLGGKLHEILSKLSSFALKYADAPTLSYTHFQSAQPTTIGKRACLWLQDLYQDAQDWNRLASTIPFLGVKGATGTQASFLSLLEGDGEKVKQLEKTIAHQFGFHKIIPIAGQTYSRKIDLTLINALASFAASAHKMATDLRLLAHDGELQEGFTESQVGSSAMPYKRNPIYSERICGLSRFVISLSQNPAYTAATQWLERSLDDSSNRRLSIPEAFLATDAILNLIAHLIPHLSVDADHSLLLLEKELPLLAMENILMAAVKKGGDRQELHERLKHLSFVARREINPIEFLLKEIEKSPHFHLTRAELEPFFDTHQLVGRAPEQVREFIKNEIEPYLSQTKFPSPDFPKMEI